MGGAFAWLGQLVEWLGSLIPRIMVVRATHGGVKFCRGHKIKVMNPGIHCYWPIITEIEVIPVARQTHNLPNQTLVTKDGKQVTLSGIVIYEIKDVVRALTKNWDYNDTVSDVSMAAIAKVVVEADYQDLISNVDRFCIGLTKETRKRLKSFGIQVHKVFITDFSNCRVIRLVGDSNPPVPFTKAL